MQFKRFIKKKFVTISISIIVLIQLLLSFQGFDICDEGFSLTFYQQFFNEPASVEYNFAYWLSGLIGGLWYQLFPAGGILWFRFLAVIVNTATLVVGFKFLSRYCNRYVVMAGLAMAMFINDFGFLLFYHNHLTAFIAVLSLVLLSKGLINDKLIFIFIAGGLCAINISTRLPNVTLLSFILGIPFYCHLQGKAKAETVFKLIYFCLGVLGGLVIIVIILHSLNQLSIMESSIYGIFDSGNSQESNHNFSKLIRVYIHSLLKIGINFIKILILVLPLIVIHKHLVKNQFLKSVLLGVGIIVFAYIFRIDSVFFLYAISLFGGFALLILIKNINLRLIVLLALVMALFLPFGSDGAMKNAGYISLWLLLPLALNVLYSVHTFHFKFHHLNLIVKNYSSQFKLVVVCICMGYFTVKAYKLSQEAYFDSGSRFDKNFVINSKFSRGIYTTKERAEIINNIVPELKKHVNPDDYLLAYESIPMLHFLTETKPYVNNPWPMIYDGFIFEKQLKRALQSKKDLPVIIQQKFYTIGDFSKPIVDYLSETKPELFNSSQHRNKVMNQFLQNQSYEIIFSNTHFNIYKPK